MLLNKKGFSLIELLIVVVILSALAYLTYLIINPEESTKRGRDTIRMNDIQLVFKAVTLAIDAAGEPTPKLLCGLNSLPCKGNSGAVQPDLFLSNGTGWVKTKIDNVAGVSVAALPKDPINLDPYTYEYIANGQYFELNGQFESKEYQEKMKLDGGDNEGKFELGTSLSLIH